MQSKTQRLLSFLLNNIMLLHSARTGIAATIALAVATIFNLTEAYWAPITTLLSCSPRWELPGPSQNSA